VPQVLSSLALQIPQLIVNMPNILNGTGHAVVCVISFVVYLLAGIGSAILLIANGPKADRLSRYDLDPVSLT